MRRTLPFALHQLLELVIGIALVGLSIHVSHPQLLVATGFAFAFLALFSQGRLGIFNLIPPRLHAGLDVAVALAAAIAPVFPPLRPDLTGILCVELAALAWLRIATLTRYRVPVPAPAGTPAGAAGGTTATGPPTAPTTGPPTVPTTVTPATGAPSTPADGPTPDAESGTAAAMTAAAMTPARVGRELDRVVNTGSRRLGRLAGSLARTYAARSQKRD